LAMAAPAHHRLLVAPDGEREQPPFGAPALQPIDVNEAVDRLEPGLELLREREIVVKPLRLGLHLENHCEHVVSPFAALRMTRCAALRRRRAGTRCSRRKAHGASPRGASNAWRG